MNLKDLAHIFDRDRVERGIQNVGAAGNEARYWAQRYDEKQSELIDTIRAQQLDRTTKNLRLSIPVSATPAASDQLKPNPGSFWKVTGVAWRFSETSNFAPTLFLNDTALFDIPQSLLFLTQNIIETGIWGTTTKPEKIVTDKDYLTLEQASVLVVPTVVDIQVEEYTMAAVFDAVG